MRRKDTTSHHREVLRSLALNNAPEASCAIDGDSASLRTNARIKRDSMSRNISLHGEDARTFVDVFYKYLQSSYTRRTSKKDSKLIEYV
jgi:hypothetical protein